MKRELEQARSELYAKDLQLKALNALIDVAEEHGVRVRKILVPSSRQVAQAR